MTSAAAYARGFASWRHRRRGAPNKEFHGAGCGHDFQFDKGVLAVTNRMDISGNAFTGR
jgi:hypothetical protein